MSFVRVQSNKIEKRNFPSEKFLKTALLGSLILIWCFLLLDETNFFPIKKVYINGDLNYLDQNQLKSDIAKYTNQGFFQIDLNKISESLQLDQWVSEVSVSKIWPSSILVKIKERLPIAKLNKDYFFDEKGEIFQPSFVPNVELLQISDLSNKPNNLFKVMHQVNLNLVKEGLFLDSLHKTKLGTIQLTLSDGKKVVLGNEEVFETNLNRLLISYKTFLKDLWLNIESVDLRYSNGLAVRFTRADQGPIR